MKVGVIIMTLILILLILNSTLKSQDGRDYIKAKAKVSATIIKAAVINEDSIKVSRFLKENKVSDTTKVDCIIYVLNCE